MKDLPDL